MVEVASYLSISAGSRVSVAMTVNRLKKEIDLDMHFNLFYSFFLHVSRILNDFSDIFALFLAQNFKTKVLTAHKNLLLECMLQDFYS